HEPYFALLDSTAMVLCQAVFCIAWPAKEPRTGPHAVKQQPISEETDALSTAATGVTVDKGQSV
ncbi:hypothetical protein JCM3770_005878, partial [Rhodotorula araucariae]